MRKTLCAVPVLMMLLCLALPVWGESPSAPPVPSPLAGARPVSSTSGSVVLPDVIPVPVFKTLRCNGSGQCGGCSGSCAGLDPGCSCLAENGQAGQCFGLQVGSDIPYCPRTTKYQCACSTFD
jgi:hypothetical protein